MQRIIKLDNAKIVIEYTSSAVGHEEFFGPLGDLFDFHDESDRFGARTWELAESELGRITLNLALKKAGLRPSDVGIIFAGDLQNQCVATSQGLASFGIPYMGLYGACSTCGEGLLSSSVFLNSSPAVERAAVVTSSHNCAAERQFRTPIEYGGQRTPTAQWTATAAGAFILRRMETNEKEISAIPDENFSKTNLSAIKNAKKPSETHTVYIDEVMVGKIVDGGVTDAGNMGAAMAPAAADSIETYLKESARTPEDFDAIITGDLGREGSEILCELLLSVGINIKKKHLDCGMLMYDFKRQDVHSGASGCGCSASVMASHFIPEMKKGKYKNVMFLATGALMSPSSIQQGGSIAGIAPVVVLRSDFSGR